MVSVGRNNRKKNAPEISSNKNKLCIIIAQE
jgi:hypothetical protein